MTTVAPSIVWFRLDLRLADNPALAGAIARGGPVVPVFIWSPDEEAPWAPGAASRWWLHHSLTALGASLRARGAPLVVLRGPSLAALRALARAHGATAVFWNRRYEPALISRDRKVEAALRRDGIAVETFNSALLHEPSDIANTSGNPFRVFTPFWKNCLAKKGPAAPLPAPERMSRQVSSSPARTNPPAGIPLVDLRLLPTLAWAAGFEAVWHPGEAGARRALDRFLDDAVHDYPTARDLPARAGTSRLSPHLHFGEISPRQVWQAVTHLAASDRRPGIYATTTAYLRQIGWREFAHHLLVHFPHTDLAPLRPDFERFPWAEHTSRELAFWQRGMTGFPIVDAGMRELWATGWMHNRVRMVAASFLVKDLLIPWQDGARWFWDTLVDADLANNTLGWQWTAGCGADAAPFFRIFNPAAQAERFDPAGEYVGRWIPDRSPLGGYPLPIVDHAEARTRALAALARMSAKGTGARRPPR